MGPRWSAGLRGGPRPASSVAQQVSTIEAPAATDRRHRLLDRAVAVDPASARRPPRSWRTRRTPGTPRPARRRPRRTRGDDVQVGHRRLDHDDVGALGDVQARPRAAPRGRWPGPAGRCAGRRLQRRLHRLAERPVEGRGVLRARRPRIADVGVPGRVQRGADRADLAVHHAARADHVRRRPRPARPPSRRTAPSVASLSTRPSGRQHAAVPVVGELVQAQVGHDHDVVADLGDARRATATLSMPSGSVAPEPTGVLACRARRRSCMPADAAPRPPPPPPCAASRACAARRPGIEVIGDRLGRALLDEHRQHQAAPDATGSRRPSLPHRGRRPQPRGGAGREPHPSARPAAQPMASAAGGSSAAARLGAAPAHPPRSRRSRSTVAVLGQRLDRDSAR